MASAIHAAVLQDPESYAYVGKGSGVEKQWSKGGRCRRCCERRPWSVLKMWYEVLRMSLVVVGFDRGKGWGACWVLVEVGRVRQKMACAKCLDREM
jgi:hypothetical protein